jgi:hypothetical protein
LGRGAQFSPYLPREQLARLRASAGVTAVTDCLDNPFIFWTWLKRIRMPPAAKRWRLKRIGATTSGDAP